MWQVIHIAHSKKEADRIGKHLQKQGFLVKVAPVSREGRDGYQILVPEFEAEDVHQVLYEEFSL
ncbi:MAG: hypothetical protein UMV23_02975 [Halanaerobium sp.]|nr:hypothetical protein [Halanaerobium sp.]